MELYLGIVVILFGLAISDLIVGVSNDAVNFLNSAIGSRVASRRTILIIASVGILLGVMFSGGMMEVARKGIFHPDKFLMPELLVIFLAVMITDIILLDLYNTFALPTSTTVSIVFELLGAAIAVSLIKIHQLGENFSELVNYINTAKALAIISGILLSIVVAFTAGMIVQFITRLIFTFDFTKRLKRYGAVWAGAALTSITYFILIKGAKYATFISKEGHTWIKENAGLILLVSLVVWAIIFQLLLWFSKVNILKIVILVGTGALALAFAANDLVNFIGVPMAGFHAYGIAYNNLTDPLTTNMTALAGKVKTDTWMLLIAGVVMVIALWVSKKARSVTKTELSLGRQDEGDERFGSTPFSRVLVRGAIGLAEGVNNALPKSWSKFLASRFDREASIMASGGVAEKAHWDHIRASVNLMVAAALISFATSLKLPLSTTYVTFMVAMGTSLADRAWGRESAVYRITGVLTVVGGWFFTAFMASTVAMLFATLIFYFRLPAIIILLGFAIFFVVRSHQVHKDRDDGKEVDEIVVDPASPDEAFTQLTHQLSDYLETIGKIVDRSFDGVFKFDRDTLKKAVKNSKSVRKQYRDTTAFIMKSLQDFSNDKYEVSPKLFSSLREIARHISTMAEISKEHVENNHRALLDQQVVELDKLRAQMIDLVNLAQKAILENDSNAQESIIQNGFDIQEEIHKLNKNQVKRIKSGGTKTRQSLLYLGLLSHAEEVTSHVVQIVKGCNETHIN